MVAVMLPFSSKFHTLWLLVASQVFHLVQASNDTEHEGFRCGLWWAESIPQQNHEIYYRRMALYAGVNFPAHSRVAEPELVLSITDANKNEWSAWHDVIWPSTQLIEGATLENDFFQDLFIPGLASLLPICSNEYHSNVQHSLDTIQEDSVGVHRSKDPSFGSFAYRFGHTYKAMHDITPGEALVPACTKGIDDSYFPYGDIHPYRSLDWLHENGVCLDTLSVKASTIQGAGRGAFSKRPVSIGEAIAVSPVLHLDRAQLHIYEQSYLPGGQDIVYTNKLKQQQLLLNYCYGHADSNVLLLPLAPGVNFINHHEQPNAYIRWGQDHGDEISILDLTHYDLLETEARLDSQTTMEIVALRKIQPGEEIFLGYGEDWSKAWEDHVHSWTPKNSTYLSAADYLKYNSGQQFRTAEEQTKKPYPANLRTACYVTTPIDNTSVEDTLVDEDDDYDTDSDNDRSPPSLNCTRVLPCEILERTSPGRYDVKVYPGPLSTNAWFCDNVPSDGMIMKGISDQIITFVDDRYTTDAHMVDSFRHEIGVPETFYPRQWLTKDERSHGDFIPTPLQPGQIEPIRWSDTGNIVSKNAYRLGLSPKIREVLTTYCDKMGITDLFRHLTMKGNALKPDTDIFLYLDGEQWYLHRPETKWRSNLQWLSPAGSPAHEHYLQALSVAGFDETLKAIGDYFDFDGLVAFHVTFIALSQSTAGYLHHDIIESDAKTFNCIIPLLIANETGPELDLQEEDETKDTDDLRIGRYRYEYEVATMMGDASQHASSAVNYARNGEMRMAATIYIADVNEDNVESISSQYTQQYPPPGDSDLLRSWAGRHWKKNDSRAKLPNPSADHILVKKEEDADHEQLFSAAEHSEPVGVQLGVMLREAADTREDSAEGDWDDEGWDDKDSDDWEDEDR